ncbi:MAG: hypothetical protein ACR2LC_09595 [Pyrinomonadaceae bacterium]
MDGTIKTFQVLEIVFGTLIALGTLVSLVVLFRSRVLQTTATGYRDAHEATAKERDELKHKTEKLTLGYELMILEVDARRTISQKHKEKEAERETYISTIETRLERALSRPRGGE